MLLPSYLRRSRHGIYYFRIVLPDRVAAVLGQREFVRSLGIRSPKIAKFSGYQLSQRIKPFFQRLQDVMAIDPNSIDPKEVKKLIVQELDFRADGSLLVRGIQTHADPAIADREMEVVRKTAKDWQEVRRDGYTSGLSDQELTQRQAVADRLRKELLDAMVETTPSAPSAVAAAQVMPHPLRPSTLKESFEQYLKSKKKISQSAKDTYTEHYELFVALVGGESRLVHEIPLVECIEFCEALVHIPAHAKKRGIKLGTTKQILKSPPELVDKKGNPIDTISGNSANLVISSLRSFFKYVLLSGRRNGPNPFDDIARHSDGEQAPGGADGFDEHELRAIFNPEYFMRAKRPGQFWGPLLALYTGARLNEIACLDLSDFVEEKGIRCIAIRHIPRAKPNTVEHKRNPRTAKQTKNAASRRLVPLHPDLYEIGIEAYMEDVKRLGATRFFPTLPADAKGKRERRLSHDGNEYLKLVGVHVDRIKVMHSFRDTVCEMLSVENMDDVRADQWTGHVNQSVKGRHYRRSKAAIELQAKEGFDALNFPFIDLEAIQYQPGWFNDYNKTNMVS